MHLLSWLTHPTETPSPWDEQAPLQILLHTWKLYLYTPKTFKHTVTEPRTCHLPAQQKNNLPSISERQTCIVHLFQPARLDKPNAPVRCGAGQFGQRVSASLP